MRRLGAGVLCLLAGCTGSQEPVEIGFVASYDGQPISCETAASDRYLSDLRFFIQDIALLRSDGTAAPLTLAPDETWQQADVVMLDLENGAGECLNGTAETNAVIAGTVEPGSYTGLTFTVGVPFAKNHADPMLAAAPLDDTMMHWHWRSGYKFLRAGVRSGDDSFWIHVGSTACKGTVRNISGCNSPNRISVRLEEFSVGSDTVSIELKALLDGTSLDDGQRSNCASGPDELACGAPFAALALQHADNQPLDTQSVFKVQPDR